MNPFKSIVKILVRLIPAGTISDIAADYTTDALQKMTRKGKVYKISEAVSATGEALKIVGDVTKDCEITGDEAKLVGDSIRIATKKIVEAARA